MIKKNKYLFLNYLILFFLSTLLACGTLNPYFGKDYRNWSTLNPPDTARLSHTVFLIGDAGTLDNNPVLNLMNKQMKAADSIISNVDTAEFTKNTVIFLGDNIYYYGLPAEDAPDRDEKEEIINNQMNSLEGFRGNKIFIPGNHDWQASTAGGLEAVNREEQYIEVYADSTIEFLPNSGCPGPYELHLSDNMVILIIDSEWWLTPHEKPIGPENGCFVDDRFDFIVQFQDAVQRNADKNILIVQHHPLFSNSNHGGRFSLMDNIFPLTLVRDNLYIPLPGIGSLYPLMRKYGISRQDIPNPLYQEYISEILSVIEDKPNIVFAAGHDHNLQLTKYRELTHIVSGSGGKTNFAARRSGTSYVQQVMGYARLNYYDNGTVWVEFWTANDDNPEGILTFKYPIYSFKPPTPQELEEQEYISYKDSTKLVVAGEEYNAGAFKKFWLGDHYRQEWTTPVKVPYLDMKTEAGGLSPVSKGGGNQTISLGLINEDSVLYNLRPLNKNIGEESSEQLQQSFIEDPVKYQISTSHPYGVLSAAKMADALDLYHTDPEIFYTPHTRLLGPYLPDFGGTLGILEMSPTADLPNFQRYGYSEKNVTTRAMLRELEIDSDNQVDSKMFLKNRLFDMLINDWDRNAEQWRWSEFEKAGEGTSFKPIARDRDQVFTKYDGVIPYLISRKWGIRYFRHFDYEIKDIIGLNFTAKNLDRRLLSDISRDEWIEEVESIQKGLTDQVLEEAIAAMPDEVEDISGKVIIEKLKSRKNSIGDWALDYYNILAKEVDITGSNQDELFLVEKGDSIITVRAYKLVVNGEKKEIYKRTFFENETDEIRVYAMGGADSILVNGEGGKNKIKVRLIGGPGEDVIIDRSEGKRLVIYDQNTEENIIKTGRKAKLRISKDPYINNYEPNNFEYDFAKPRFTLEYNIDQGIYAGMGIYFQKSNFRNYPGATHLLVANYAFNTKAPDFLYEGNFYSLFGKNWDLTLNGRLLGPGYVFNYFGSGNATSKGEAPISYYRINMDNIKLNPTINRRYSDFFKIGLGPIFEYFNLKDNNETIIDESGIGSGSSYYFWGGNLFADLGIQDYEKDPTRGVKWLSDLSYYKEFNGAKASFAKFTTDVTVYISPNLPVDVTAAVRFGASKNIGDFRFFQSQFLGGNTNLRGYRNNRFAGESSMFNNTEIRLRLFDIKNPVFSGNYGLVGFLDSGRVWSDSGETSTEWHRSYGSGLYVNFYKIFLLSGTVGFSKEGEFFNVQLGHFF